MKRVWKFSDAAQAQLFCFRRTSAKPKPRTPLSAILKCSTTHRCTREVSNQSHSSEEFKFRDVINLFSDPPCRLDLVAGEDLGNQVTRLRDELVRDGNCERVSSILDEYSDYLFGRYPDKSALTELLKQLESWPKLALEVFNWGRKFSDGGFPMSSSEYSKGIQVAGRAKNVSIAVELFNEAAEKQMTETSTYNALMSAFMFNGLADKCHSLFCVMKNDATCSPNIVTYNLLISVFGRMLLIDHMEAAFQEIIKLNLLPSVFTYNNLIAGYIAAWNWNSMERTFQRLKSSPLIVPDIRTYLLILRGYSHSGNLEKMEEVYLLVKDHVIEKDIPLVRSMICAYLKSSAADRVKKIEALLEYIPEEDYRPWLNVLLIKLYAQLNWLEEMENWINKAFEHKTSVVSTSIMRCIITTYFRCDAVDRLANFVRLAELAGWRVCRSLYHCKMVMYGSQHRLPEMESVLYEMASFNLDCTKKTLWIMYYAYLSSGQRSKVKKILGLMWKHGYEIPLHAFPS